MTERKIWEVYENDQSFYVRDLRSDYWKQSDSIKGCSDDVMLLYMYPEGDVDPPRSVEKMHASLYDLVQCNSSINEMDIFETPFGNFWVEGVDVLRCNCPTVSPITCKGCE